MRAPTGLCGPLPTGRDGTSPSAPQVPLEVTQGHLLRQDFEDSALAAALEALQMPLLVMDELRGRGGSSASLHPSGHRVTLTRLRVRGCSAACAAIMHGPTGSIWECVPVPCRHPRKLSFPLPLLV